MPKQGFSSLDINVVAHELSETITSLRVSNIYDLSSRIFLFKFAKPNHRHQLVVESGFRCHLTSFARTAAASPSPFVARLRKFLKTRRVTRVSQVGTDRIIEIQFSDGQFKLFLEFYARGNIVLTDRELKVIALFRNVNEGDDYERIRIGSMYDMSHRQNIDGVPTLNADRVRIGLQRYLQRQADPQQASKKKANKKKTRDALRSALAGCATELPPLLIEHALRVSKFDPTLDVSDIAKDDQLIGDIVNSLQQARDTVSHITKSETIKGYIIAKPRGLDGGLEGDTEAEVAAKDLVYQDFQPFRPKQFEDDPLFTIIEIEGYNKAVDEFFSAIEGQKLESRLIEKGETARKKLDHARQDQEKRLDGLKEVQTLNVQKAQAIEVNLYRVEEATAAINSLIAQGMDWIEIDRLIEMEQDRKNPVAMIIKTPLKLQHNTATLLLSGMEMTNIEDNEADLTDSEPSEGEDDEDDSSVATRETTKKESKVTENKSLTIDIDLSLSAWSNAREYYDQKKTAAAKEEKTFLASNKAMKSAERKINADLKKALNQEKQTLRPVRQPFWFERFIYFLSSDGYLVIGARDGQQADILYRKHFRKGDVFVHANLDGAIPFIIRNRVASEDSPIPPSTLSQVGNLSVSTSSAWDSKAVMSAWWVPRKQVSKKAPTGDYLPPGRFNVQDPKHPLPPAQLLLGFAVLFQISESSKANHQKHRIQHADTQSENPVPYPDDEEFGEEKTGGLGDEDHLSHDQSEAEDEPEDAEDEPYDQEDTRIAQAYTNPLQTNGDTPASGLTNQSEVDNLREKGSEDDHNSDVEDEEKAEDPSIDQSGSDAAPDASGVQSLPDRTTKPKPPANVRGKKGKAKKIAAKYADQDEEDRAAAMALLGSAGKEKAAAEAKAKEERERKNEEQKRRRQERHLRAQREGLAHEEARLATEEGDPNEDEQESTLTIDLETLVGTPLPGDEILEAIPVCAPWSALGRYKYRAKIQPGNAKKGKALRDILAKWAHDAQDKKRMDESSMDVEKIWPREKELLGAWKDTEVFGVIPVSKLRVMMPGATSDKESKKQAHGKGGRGSKGSKRR